MKKSLIALLGAASLLLVSCTGKGWSVNGKVANAGEDTKVAVEAFNPAASNWYNLDSVKLQKDGSFSYKSEHAAPYADIYRISIDGRSIYFPIDSIDNVTITADAADFDRSYTLAGSDVAVQMMDVDKLINDYIAKNGAEAAATDSLLKRRVSEVINNDNSGVLAYYLINKTVGDRPLYSMESRTDVRVLGALANKFETLFPDDPRTSFLKDRFLRARAAFVDTNKVMIEANETGLLDITLYDVKGKEQKLSDIAKKSGITLLNFTSYEIEPSLAYNIELNRLYEKYKDQNISIYQVSIDEDEVEWRNNAQSLPWVTVRCTPEEASRLVRIYNVGAIPVTFVINRNSDLVERIDGDPAQIDAAIRKHL